jgi:hypothetical protein
MKERFKSTTSNNANLHHRLTNPVSTFGVKIILDPFTMPFPDNVPSCNSLFVAKKISD